LASIFVHALVDFPLYVPLPLAIMGALLGVLAVQAGEAGCGRKIHPPAIDVLRFVRAPLVSGALTIALIAWIGQPALADIAASRALAELIAGRGGEGLYWQSVARRLEPAYGRRYWEEGIIMRDQAIESNDSARADKADALFAEGMRVDPYDVNNFVERARLHRTQQQLLTQRATPDELLSWSAHVLKVRPYLPASQAEYARALNNAGRTEEARRLARTIIERHPESQVARRLAAELSSK
jgi:tetratricopeptide (TPR) repeat protein